MDIYASTARAASRACNLRRSDGGLDLVPVDFDPAACPILAKHFFGTEAVPPVGETTTEVVTGLRRERQIEHVYRLGVRAVAEMLFEVAGGEDLDRALEAYGRLTPDLLKALGGDQFPPAPLHEVRRTL